jgi:tripartite-type tricarboxylate transporter receptor subunit TctC
LRTPHWPIFHPIKGFFYMPTRRATLAALAMSSVAPALATTAWPDRPIHWLVGFPAGSGPDLLTRLLTQRLEAAFGQSIVIENRPGAASNLAAGLLARAAPDGLTLGTLAAAPLAVNRHVYRSLPFDPGRDFTLLSEFARFPAVVMVHPSVPVTTLAELDTWLAAQNPPALFATPGAGVIPHLATEMLMRRLGRRCELVHYRGNPDALRDLSAGRVPLIVDAFPTALPLIRDGRARGLAVTSLTRSPLAPGLPPVAETLPGFEAASWLAVGGPTGLPGPVAARIEAAVIAAAAEPELVQRFFALGAEAVGSTRASLGARIAAEDARWGELARAAGITAD